jgi:drug/metabolite transporter (DMT)-like permease
MIIKSRIASRVVSRASAHVVLFAGLFLVSTSGPFIVLTHMDAFAIVFYRMIFAAILFLAWAAARGELRLPAAHVARTIVGSLFLTSHFLLWVKAFDLTDFASNLLLLVAQPVIAALLGVRLGENPTRETWISIALATAGLAVIAGGDFALGPRALLGDLMCIVGGFAIAMFYVVTRDARAAVPLDTFMGATLLIGATATLPIVLLTRAPLGGYTVSGWAWMAALVVLTTVGGHGLMNLAARHVKLFTLNVVIVLEPAIAIAIGAVLIDKRATPIQLGGGVLLAAAVIVGLRTERAAATTS